MDGEVIQPEVKGRRRPLVLAVVIVIILMAMIAWLGNWAINQRAGRPALTELQKQEILRSLALPPGTKPLSTAQKNGILKSLRLPPGAIPLTNAQKAEIMKSLNLK